MAMITVSSRYGDTTFESNHPSQQALFDRLNTLVSRQEIVNDHAVRLVQGWKRYGSWKPYHEGWAAFHVAKHDHPERFQQGNRDPQVTGLYPIVEHLTSSSLKNPCIILTVSQQEIGEQTIALKVCGPRSKRAGCISVAESPRFGEGAFYGYIDTDGNFEPRHGTPDLVTETLQRVAEDPPRVISEIGRQSGLCCYCNHPLTQVQSKIAGAGKTCCQNYGIDYPNAARTREILATNSEWLDGATDADRWLPKSDNSPRPLLDAVIEDD
jgi:hypothetical protein